MWLRRFFLIALTVTSTAAAHGPSTSIPPVNQRLSGPPAALEALARAYRGLSVDAIDAVLTIDYRFHSMGDSLLNFTRGTSRDDEMSVVRSLLEGGPRMPRADSIGMSFDGVTEGADPEHADSTQHYQVLVVTRAEFGLRLATGTRLLNRPSQHVFHVVRGTVALLPMGRTADPERWYIRRWLEDVTALRAALRERKGDCGEQDPPVEAGGSAAPAAPALPGVLAIRALTNPACAALRIGCDLPGGEPAKVEVYDVGGRLVNTRQVPVKGPGSVTVDAGAGTQLLPGVYWVRLAQATRRPSTRMVVVAR